MMESRANLGLPVWLGKMTMATSFLRSTASRSSVDWDKLGDKPPLFGYRFGSMLGVLLTACALLRPELAAAEEGRITYEVEMVKDIRYYEGPDADEIKHKLDLYLPKNCSGFPVLFFIHGGAWSSGDKRYLLDVYGRLGRNFARQGIAAVVTNYRLSPKVQHPCHIQDVAKAFAWTVHNIARYGGDPGLVFVCGHSAGGHLAALLATDRSYVEAEKCSLRDIRGVIPVSGVYSLPPGRLFESVFTADPKKRAEAMPLSHVKGGHPPFLILYAARDFPTCDRMSRELCDALTRCQCQADVVEIQDRDHMTIIAAATNPDDPTARMIVDFIEKHREGRKR
jgi:pimeloyl-ACP methyl ester carboxylesterase